MNLPINRRNFLGIAAASGMALGARRDDSRIQGANARLVVGVMGTGGRGTALAGVFQRQPNVDVAYVCDVDQGHAAGAADAVAKAADGRAPKAVTDFRKILD